MERSREVEVSMHITLDIQPIDSEVAAYQGLGSRLIVAES